MKEVTMPYVFDKYESEYQEWKNSGYQGCTSETIEFIDNLMHRQSKTLWAHQKEAILRIIFLYEIKKGIKQRHLLKIVTGGGKTLIIASIIAWLKYAHNDINKFLIIVPNLIVRDRIVLDFVKEGDRLTTIFEDWDMTPDKALNRSINAVVLSSGSSPQAMVGADVIITNIQELYPVHTNTGANLAYIYSNFNNIVIFNDEAHNTNADLFNSILKSLEDKTILRIDTTATPERADGTYPTSSLIYQFDIKDAILTTPPIIKDIVVYQPETKLVEITYTNAETRERKKINEMNKEFEEAEKQLKPFQWIMDKAPLKMLTQIVL
ncbi:MAG: DEAD/DEAH box helicase family protein, partial [Candidatus Parvarchaeum sp.]